jgi:hypothetical protein
VSGGGMFLSKHLRSGLHVDGQDQLKSMDLPSLHLAKKAHGQDQLKSMDLPSSHRAKKAHGQDQLKSMDQPSLHLAKADIHVAATHYDPVASEHVMYIGLNGLPNADDDGVPIDADAHMCFCSGGAFLRIRGMPHPVTSIMHKGQPLCVGKCAISETLITNIKSTVEEENKYTIQIESLPNAPIIIRTDRLTLDSQRVVGADVSIMSGDLGRLVPAWICIAGGLQVFVGDMHVGCLNSVETSFQDIEVERDSQSIEPVVKQIQLTEMDDDGHDGETDSFYLTSIPEDQTEDLAYKLEHYLLGGDAIITTCGGEISKSAEEEEDFLSLEDLEG